MKHLLGKGLAWPESLKEGEKLIKVSFQKIIETIKQISQFKDLFRFLIAFDKAW